LRNTVEIYGLKVRQGEAVPFISHYLVKNYAKNTKTVKNELFFEKLKK